LLPFLYHTHTHTHLPLSWCAAAGTTEFLPIGAAVISLSDIWAGTGGDLTSQQLQLLPMPEDAHMYPSGVAGTLTLTLLAESCLRQLRAGHQC
jgi:hypothetical protein